jgi:hypothetical protein
MWRESKGFRLHPGGLLLRLAESGGTTGQRSALLVQLQDFEADFPMHPRIQQSYLVTAKLAYELEQFALAGDYFVKVDQADSSLNKGLLEQMQNLLGLRQ